MVRRVSLLLIAAWLAVILLAPKEQLYYLLERQLSRQGVVLGGEQFHWRPLGFKITNAKIYFQGIEVGRVPEARFWTLLAYSELRTGPLLLSPEIRKFLDLKLTRARLIHEIWHPRTLLIDAEGDFGHLRGSIDLQRRLLHLRLDKTGKIDGLKRYFKRDKEGWVYEQKF
jgi:hypothetical protein